MKKILYLLTIMVAMACGMECSAQTVSGQIGGRDYVNLGLPSGTKWATYNVGGEKPTDSAVLFAWGETKPKKKYNWKNYKWCNGNIAVIMNKYCAKSLYGQVDNKKTLDANDDAATTNWGDSWRMPSYEEMEELRKGCIWSWTENFNESGVNGVLGTSITNGNTIFLPAAGFQDGNDVSLYNNNGAYWSITLSEEKSDESQSMQFDADGFGWNNENRNIGLSVRAVAKDSIITYANLHENVEKLAEGMKHRFDTVFVAVYPNKEYVILTDSVLFENGEFDGFSIFTARQDANSTFIVQEVDPEKLSFNFSRNIISELLKAKPMKDMRWINSEFNRVYSAILINGKVVYEHAPAQCCHIGGWKIEDEAALCLSMVPFLQSKK